MCGRPSCASPVPHHPVRRDTLKTAHFMDDESYSYKYNIPYDLETRSADVDFKMEHSTFDSLDGEVI